MATKVTLQTNTRTTTHNVDMHGVSGAAFWCVLVGTLVFAIGFATPSWYTRSNVHIGVWESCNCGPVGNDSDAKTVQAMTTIGLIFLILAFIMAVIYMFFHKINKNIILILLTVFCFCAVLFILVGVIVFGQKYEGHLNYSFAFAIIGGILVAIAGVLGIVQISQSGLCA